MTDNKAKVSPSELILSAVFNSQQNNGVSPTEISKYIAKKYGCPVHQIQNRIESALKKATEYGILAEEKGMYRIQDFGGVAENIKKPNLSKKKSPPKRKSIKRKINRKKKAKILKKD